MKGTVCKMCGYVSLEGVPGKCPVCGAPSSAFEEKENALKIAQDKDNPSELEKKHLPVIKVVRECGLIPGGCTDVHVKVGEIQHPMADEHHIEHIDFYIDKVFVSRVKLTPAKLNPAAALHLKDAKGRFTAVSSCNLHGDWISETEL